MIINIPATYDPNKNRMSVGEYNMVTKVASITYPISNGDMRTSVVKIPLFEMPAGATKVNLENRELGDMHECTPEQFKTFPKDDKYVYYDYKADFLKKTR